MARLQSLWDELSALLNAVIGDGNREQALDDWARRSEGTPLGHSGDPLWDRAQCEFSISKAIVGNYPELFGVQVDAGREREISAELARRSGSAFKGIPVPLAALSVKVRDCPPELLRNLQRKDVISSTTPPGGPGGSLIPTYLDPQEYIDVLRPAIAVRQLGARVLSNLSANLNLPKMKQAASSGWFAENTAIMRSDEEFEVVELRPRHCGAILEASRNMIGAAAQSSPDLEAIMRNDLAQVLARRVDLTAISGAGTPIEPLGIITDAEVARMPPGPPSYDMLVDMTSELATRNALEGSLGWIANATVRGWLLKEKDDYGRPYGLDLLFQGMPYAFTNLAGSTSAPNPVVFGNWSDLLIGFWSEIDLLLNPYAEDAFSKGNVLLRGAMTMDLAKRHVESFAWLAATPPPPPDATGAAAQRPTAPATPPPATAATAAAAHTTATRRGTAAE
jgi:HK97 family phage major capsid protein